MVEFSGQYDDRKGTVHPYKLADRWQCVQIFPLHSLCVYFICRTVIIQKGQDVKRSTLTAALLVLATFGLDACATRWAPGPGVSAEDFPPTKARCSIMARHGGGGFVAVGSTGFVAGAALGAAIGNTIRVNRDFSDCMEANGFQRVDEKTIAIKHEKASRLKVMLVESKTCIAEVKARPEFAILLPHIPDAETNEYTMTQLADTTVPTAVESQLLASYLDSIGLCTGQFINRTSSISPKLTSVLSNEKSSIEANEIPLIRRETSWGAAAQANKQVKDRTKEELHTVHI